MRTKPQTPIAQIQQDAVRSRPNSNTCDPLFRPASMLGAALAATALFCALITLTFEGQKQTFYLYYFAPVALPFTCFLIERTDMLRSAPRWPYLVDLPVLILSMVRAFYPLPFISGHAFFLTYALLTTNTWPARASAALVLLEVIILKVFVWHDATLLGGMAVAGLSALILMFFQKKT